MSIPPDAVFPVLIGVVVTFGASVLIVVTKRWQGVFAFDAITGPQKFHHTLTPRIGGLAVFVGFWAAAGTAGQPLRELLFALGMSGVFAFSDGFADDVTKRVLPTLRLFMMMLSGLVFCLMTGYSVTRVEVPFIDTILEFHYVSIAFTAIAIAGLSNAVNVIDGFHGLAAGSVIIMLAALAVVASYTGDLDVATLALVIGAVLSGFLLVNFPFGYVFLGDGGAYFAGFLLGSLAVMLPMRNPELSPWVSLLILSYPVLETVFSSIRKTVRRGHSPSQPDRLHLHMLVYRSYARRIGNVLGSERLSNPLTSVLMWGGIMTSLVCVVVIPYTREWSILALSLQAGLYVLIYRRVALLPLPRIMKRSL